MTKEELDQLEATIPEQAVQALTNAHRQALEAVHEVLTVVDGKLVCIGAKGMTVLSEMSPRLRVKTRTKRATT